MSLESIATSIQSTSFSDALKAASWVVPTLQSIHIVMIGVVFVSVLMIALRVLGWMRADEPLRQVWVRFAPFMWAGIVVMAVTGALLTAAEPVREFMTLSFRLKMVLLVVLITCAVAFGRSVRRAARNASAGPAPAGVRFAAVVTLVLWFAVIVLGRAIAYDTSFWGELSPTKSLGGAAT
jgi:uncharacterized membrane protein